MYKRLISCAFLMSVMAVAAPLHSHAGSPAGPAEASVDDTQTASVIEGTVTDLNGEPIIGASVKVAGEQLGTTTDVDGKFSIKVPKGARLEISYVGCKMQIVEAVPGKAMTISLEPSNFNLDEVVVVGYSTQRKGDLTGSIATASAEQVASRRATTLSEALQGTMSGVTVTRSSGNPDAGGDIKVRGITTINDSSPLVLIDGVPGNINTVNPDDVESISVLKDAASAAIYGSRAASGVILVTTKRAKSGTINLSYNFEYGWSKQTYKNTFVDATRFMEMANELRYNDNPAAGWNQVYGQEHIDKYWENNANDPIKYPNTDWRSLMIDDTSTRMVHTLTISGGGEKIRNTSSLRFDDHDGFYKNKDFKRMNVRSNTDYDINKYISSHLDFFFQRSHIKNAQINPLDMHYLAMPPIYGVKWADGSWCDVKSGENPIAKLEDGGSSETIYQRVQGRLGIDIRPFEGLVISGVVAPQWNTTQTKNFVRQVPYSVESAPGVVAGYQGGFAQTTLREVRNNDYEITTQFFANYNNTFGKHDVSAMVGYEDWYGDWEVMGAGRDAYELHDYPYLDLGSKEFRSNYGSKTNGAYHSVFGRANYNFDHRYLVQFNFRRDGSSRFSKSNRWANFPSVSVGWILSQEKFWEKANMSWFNYLKLRGSWGRLGNERLGSWYPYQATIVYRNAIFLDKNGQPISYQVAGQETYAVPDITWETTESWNVGFDAYFLNSRLRASFEYYRKNTKDMLLALEIPKFIGYANPQVNAGRMHTNGWDLELGWMDKIGEVSYSVSANVSDFKSKMGDLNGTQFLGSQVKMEGSEFNEWYGYLSDGLFQTQEEIDNSALLNKNTRPGDIKYKDISGPDGVPDGVISPEYDRVLLGGSLPRFSYGFGGSVQWKDFDLNFAFQGVGKWNRMYHYNQWVGYSENWLNFPTLLEGNYWSANNTAEQNNGVFFPRLTSSNLGNNTTTSDYWLYNGHYLRLKNLTLGYTLPNRITRVAGIQTLRVYVTGTDFLTFGNHPKGWDPEQGAGSYPITKSFLIGANVKF